MTGRQGRQMRKAMAIVVAGSLLAGCAGGGTGTLDAETQAVAPRDEAKAVREVAIPGVRVSGGENQLALTLGARIDRQSQSAPQLRAEITYTATAARTYDTARDLAGKILRTERPGSGDRCKPGVACAYVEIVRIELPDAELRQAKATGYRLKLFARNGPEIEIGIPGGQIAALYDKIDGAAAPRAARKGS